MTRLAPHHGFVNGWVAEEVRCPIFNAGTVVEMLLPFGAGGGIGFGSTTGVVGWAYRSVAVGGAHGAA